MNFNDIVDTCHEIWAVNPRQSMYISGPPGCGKTSLANPIADKLQIPRENVHIFRPSLHDPVDLDAA